MLNKVFLLILMSMILILSACGDANVETVENDGSARFKGIDGSIKIITDKETGCKYIFVEDGIGNTSTEAMTPLVKNKTEFDCGQ